jgi:hypothetical protein
VTWTGWRKSSRSDSGGYCVEAMPVWRSACSMNNACVEVATTPDVVLVRDSKDPDGPRLEFGADDWRAFLDGIRDGTFDLGH